MKYRSLWRDERRLVFEGFAAEDKRDGCASRAFDEKRGFSNIDVEGGLACCFFGEGLATSYRDHLDSLLQMRGASKKQRWHRLPQPSVLVIFLETCYADMMQAPNRERYRNSPKTFAKVPILGHEQMNMFRI